MREFTCAVCGAIFFTRTTEAEANREFLDSGMSTGSTLLSACDDCYAAVMGRARELGLLE